jgi:cathepsin B
LITSEYVENLKSQVSFQVYDYENHPFKDHSEAQLKAMLGMRRHPEYVPKKMEYGIVDSSLPTTFDARTQWPTCVHAIRNQAQCGSCWAFAASETLSDRFCIATSGKTNIILSPQDLVSCDKSDYGCEGGYLDHSWQYLVNTGIVSDDCLPYTSGSGSVAACPQTGKCKKGTWKKYRASDFTQFQSVNEIKQSLVSEGPVETGFDVYDDFMNYKGGVYVRKSSTMLGGHAVKVVGWGNQGGVEHWIVANSWGSAWGESGFFRIKFGECNFDSDMIAGTPLASQVQAIKNLH